MADGPKSGHSRQSLSHSDGYVLLHLHHSNKTAQKIDGLGQNYNNSIASVVKWPQYGTEP